MNKYNKLCQFFDNDEPTQQDYAEFLNFQKFQQIKAQELQRLNKTKRADNIDNSFSGKDKTNYRSSKGNKFGGMDGSNFKSSQKGQSEILDQEFLEGSTIRKRSKRGGKSVQKKREMALRFQNQGKENAFESNHEGYEMKGETDTEQKKFGENRGLNALEESITSFSTKNVKKKSKERLYNGPMKTDNTANVTIWKTQDSSKNSSRLQEQEVLRDRDINTDDLKLYEVTEKSSENETQSIHQSALQSALSSSKIVESFKNESEQKVPEKLSKQIESAEKSSKDSVQANEEQQPINVFEKLEEYLIQMASRTPQPSLEKLKKSDPITGVVNIQDLILDFINRPEKSTEAMLNLIKEIMRQTSDEKLKVDMIYYLLDLELQRKKQQKSQPDLPQNAITDENVKQYHTIIQDLQAQIKKQQSHNQLQASYIDGLEKKCINELKALKLAQYEANQESQSKQNMKFGYSNKSGSAHESNKFSQSKFKKDYKRTYDRTQSNNEMGKRQSDNNEQWSKQMTNGSYNRAAIKSHHNKDHFNSQRQNRDRFDHHQQKNSSQAKQNDQSKFAGSSRKPYQNSSAYSKRKFNGAQQDLPIPKSHVSKTIVQHEDEEYEIMTIQKSESNRSSNSKFSAKYDNASVNNDHIQHNSSAVSKRTHTESEKSIMAPDVQSLMDKEDIEELMSVSKPNETYRLKPEDEVIKEKPVEEEVMSQAQISQSKSNWVTVDENQTANQSSSIKASEKSVVSKRVELEMNAQQEVVIKSVQKSDNNPDHKISSHDQQKSAAKVDDSTQHAPIKDHQIKGPNNDPNLNEAALIHLEKMNQAIANKDGELLCELAFEALTDDIDGIDTEYYEQIGCQFVAGR